MFITTEHSTLQNARATAITQSTSRAAIFVTAVSAGMVALGLTASATHLDTAFYAFGTILLLTLAAIGFATFDWVLQSGIEDRQYAERIEALRAYYFDVVPELTRYMASVPSSHQLAMHGSRGRRWRVFRTVTGMIGLVTAVLTGFAAGLLDALAFGRSVTNGFITDTLVTVAVLAALLWFEHRAWASASRERVSRDENEEPETHQAGPEAGL
jgi:hypothetical protein